MFSDVENYFDEDCSHDENHHVIHVHHDDHHLPQLHEIQHDNVSLLLVYKIKHFLSYTKLKEVLHSLSLRGEVYKVSK
jgi:hypothetical protein